MDCVLITGADGFVASHLIGELSRETGWRLVGIGLKPETACAHIGMEDPGIEYKVVDLTDRELVYETLESISPDAVFHLAAQPSVAFSWEDPWATYEVNLIGQLNLMEGVRRLGIKASIHIACSSEEYGKVPAERMPLGEETPLSPCSHYAVSKVAQETLGRMYNQAFGWRVLVTRGFNQAGPGQSPDFVVSSFARQIAMIEAGKCEPVLKVGNLEASRDFTDVRDTVRAYRLVMEKGDPNAVYNVASGEARPVSDLLEMLLSFSESAIGVERDPDRQRPSDIPVVVGDSSRLKSDTGWEPLIPIEQTLKDTLDFWRARVSEEG